MESNSKAGRIQCTAASAELLKDCPDFSVVRRGLIDVKGKGKICTYWVLPLDASIGDDTCGSYEEEEISTRGDAEGHEKLITRNVAYLENYLRKIIAFRASSIQFGIDPTPKSTEPVKKTKNTVIDEVVDIIALPSYNAQHSRQRKTFEKLEVPRNVKEQLIDYVSTIQTMYRDDNEFHNFKVFGVDFTVHPNLPLFNFAAC